MCRGALSFERISVLTVSSREIAELTGKRHDHVMRDIRRAHRTAWCWGLPKFWDTYRNEQNGQLYPPASISLSARP